MAGEEGSWLEERLALFKELQEQRQQSAADNLTSTQIEDAELRVNPQQKARLARKKAKAEAYLAKQAAVEADIDVERQNNLTYSIEETERWNEKIEAKDSKKDPGFTDYAQLTRRKYEKLTEKLDPQAILSRNKEESLQAMSSEIIDQQKERLRLSRRRRFDDTEDITFINEKNARFNKKVARAYDQFTEDIKESLERGSAA